MSTLRRFLLLMLAATALLPLSLTLAHDRGHAGGGQVTIYGTAAQPATGPSTRSPPTASGRASAPTTSSPTSCRRRITCSSRGMSPRSARRSTSPIIPEFAARRTTKVVDGITFASDWFTGDFTLAELKTLRAKERLPDLRQRNTIYNGRYTIPTLQEVIDLRDQLSRELHRRIGIVPELKHSTYFRSIGLPLEEPFVRTLRRDGIASRGGKVTVQSFEVGNLKALRPLLPGVPLVQLFDAKSLQPGDVLAAGGTTTYGDMVTPAGLREVARYADVASPSKDYIVPRDASGRSLAPTTFVADAHAAGLDVVAYTFRNENSFLPLELRSGADPAEYGNPIAEYRQFFRLGVDGVFSDNADTAKAARDGE